MSQDVFARVGSDGTVVEWPVLQRHVENRGLPARFYERVRQVPPPSHDSRTHTVARRMPVRDGGGALVQAWEVVPRSLGVVRRSFLARLANLRWQRETGGIEVGGMAVRTDDKTQGRLTAAQSAFDKGLITSVDWKLGDQAWVTLAEAQLDQIVAAVTAHVAACFAAEKVVSDQITAAPDVDALAALDLTAAFEAAYATEISS